MSMLLRLSRRLCPLIVIAAILPRVGAESIVVGEEARPSDAGFIREQTKAWDNAIVSGDFDSLEGILAEEYSDGEVSRKSYVAYLQILRAMGIEYTESSRDNLRIQFYEDAALISGDWTQRGSKGSAGGFALSFSFTQLWVQREGKWVCATSAPNQARNGLAHFDVLRLGPNTTQDVVILFAGDANYRDRNRLRKKYFVEEHCVRSYSPFWSPIGGHEVWSLTLSAECPAARRQSLIDRLLRSAAVYRVFEETAVEDITVQGEFRGRSSN